MELQKLNDINIELPTEVPIEEIFDNPRMFAIDFMEQMFKMYEDKFQEAYEMGEKFALTNQGIIKKDDKRVYLDNKPIDDKLPPAYAYGDSLDNPGEICGNCKFYVHTKTGEHYCSQWDAEIREQYWCKKWQN